MNKQQIEEHNANYLSHYGVKGMKWGVRKSRQERREANRASRDRARGLRQQRKDTANKHFDDMRASISRREAAINKAYDKKLNDALKEHTAQSKGKLDRLIGQTLIKKMNNMDRSDAISKAIAYEESKYVANKRKRKAAHREAVVKLEDKMNRKWDAGIAKTKGMSFKEASKVRSQLDKELLNETFMGYLEIDAKYGIKG